MPQILIVLIIMVVHFPMKSIILVILTLTCIAMECYGKSPLKQYVNHHFYIFLSSINAPSIHIYTSSTAQGGGGSFKKRKPIGEVGCCESGMAERSH